MTPQRAPAGFSRSGRSGRLVLLLCLVSSLSAATGCSAPQSVGEAREVSRPERTGPVADYEPVRSVWSHAMLEETAPEVARALDRTLGPWHRVSHSDALSRDEDAEAGDRDGTLVWLRDYAPIYVRGRYGRHVAIRYLSENPNRVDLNRALPGGESERLPLIHENGNLAVAGDLVFFTERIFEDNNMDPSDASLVRAGYHPRTRREVLAILAERLQVPEAKLVAMPTLPFEATGHIDTYLLALGPRTVAVPELTLEALSLVTDVTTREVGATIASFLDEQAVMLAELGLRVLRPPMLPPALGLPDDVVGESSAHVDWNTDPGEEELVLFTPVNALLSDVGSERLAFVPSFTSVAENHPELSALARRYEADWVDMLADEGWRAVPADATELVVMLGLIRCVTATVPR